MDFKERVFLARKEKGLSQEALAEIIGVSRQAVSKWETGQSEPSARNLAELAQLLETSLAELTAPSRPEPPAKGNPILRRNLEILAVGGFTGMVILSGVKTNDPYFLLYVSAITLVLACLMAFNISRLPAEVRLKTAWKELVYCVTVYCIMTFLTPLIGNVFAGGIVLVCCVAYAKYIRFPHYNK